VEDVEVSEDMVEVMETPMEDMEATLIPMEALEDTGEDMEEAAVMEEGSEVDGEEDLFEEHLEADEEEGGGLQNHTNHLFETLQKV